MTDFVQQLEADGFAVVPNVIDTETADALVDALSDETGADSQRGSAVFARRNLLDNAAIRTLALSPDIRALVAPILGRKAFAARGLFFDKTAGANWNLIWHQDLTIAVRVRREVAGFGPWSEKAGVVHVQPPVEILERMLAVRIHLDDCGATMAAARPAGIAWEWPTDAGSNQPMAVKTCRRQSAPSGAATRF